MDLYLEVIGTHQRASFDQKNEKICVFTRCLSGKRSVHWRLGKEKEMATHSSVLAWRIPRMGEPGGLPAMGLHRV